MLSLGEFIQQLQEMATANDLLNHKVNFIDCIIRKAIKTDRLEWIEDPTGPRLKTNVAFNLRLIPVEPFPLPEIPDVSL